MFDTFLFTIFLPAVTTQTIANESQGQILLLSAVNLESCTLWQYCDLWFVALVDSLWFLNILLWFCSLA